MDAPISSRNPETNFVLAEEIGDKGILTLNRPEALNTLRYDMLRKISACISEWRDTKSLILIKGNGGKAFCAGGDLKPKTEVKDRYANGRLVSRTIYQLIYMIESLKIPYVALIDGITMGSGVGLSVHGKYRVATERTVFAMPEAAIGYFPDVGASYFLPRLQGKLGYYLGLTGYRLRGGDVLHAGIATHYCDSSRLPVIEKALLTLRHSNDVEYVLNNHCPKLKSEFSLAKHLHQINKSFTASSVEGILSNLERDSSEWAKRTIKSLRKCSPTSLKVTFHGLKLGSGLSLEECSRMEYRLNERFSRDCNFFEGIRAVLIDKDNNPKWKPSRIEDVTEQKVHSYFEPLPDGDCLPINTEPISKL